MILNKRQNTPQTIPQKLKTEKKRVMGKAMVATSSTGVPSYGMSPSNNDRIIKKHSMV